MLEDGVLPVGVVFIAIVGTAPVLNASKVCVPFDVTLVLSPSSFLRCECAFAGMEVAIVLFAILSYHTPDPRATVPAYGDDQAAPVGSALPVDLTEVPDFAG